MDDMIDVCVPFLVEGGEFPDEAAARKALLETLPKLKRWKTA